MRAPTGESRGAESETSMMGVLEERVDGGPFAESGEMGRLIRAHDWATTPLGPIDGWSGSLRGALNLVLASPLPSSLTWGPQQTQLYNDAFRPILGQRHPRALGRTFDDCWHGAFPGTGLPSHQAGARAVDSQQRLFLARDGRLEEMFFTYAITPVPDERGEVGGHLHQLIDVTATTLDARRLRALADLAEATAGALTLEQCLAAAARALAQHQTDLPLLLFYLLDEAGTGARLIAGTKLPPGGPGHPERQELTVASPVGAWPLAAALAARRPLPVTDVQARFAGLTAGPYPEPITAAFVLPVGDGPAGAKAVVVAGASQRARLDDAHSTFYNLLSAALGDAVARSTAAEDHRRRELAVAELDRARMSFFSNISHELRTPLTMMLGPIEDELAETDQPLPPGRHARLAAAHRNSLRLLRMVNTLLDFSHIEAGRMQASFEPVDLAAVTEDLGDSFRAPIEKAGLRLSTRLEALPEPVYVDREMWAKIVLNLLSNALKHTFQGGITLSLFASDENKEFVELRVDDTGVGIPEKELPRLFQRSHRVKGLRSRSDEGTGVGLALVRALAKLHGGDVSVVSRPGLGSSFRVRLRRGSAHLPPDRIASARPQVPGDDNTDGHVVQALQWSKDDESTASEVRNLDLHDPWDELAAIQGPQPRVLLADANNDMRKYLARLLGRRYQVRVVGDREAALQEAQANPPDIIVLDVRLPGHDSFELLKALRAAEATRLIPVILLSARAGEDAALEGLDAGADDYLVKPFSGKALLARVRSSITLAKLRKDSANKLAEANKELEAFSYSVSHDLRTPLRAIDGFSRALLAEQGAKLDDQGRRYLERIRAGAQRMAELIDDLLSLSRITRGALNRDRVDLSAIARKVLGDLAARDPERKVEVTVSDGLVAHADARLVTALFENLLGNAWKFSSKVPQARIQVTSESRDEGVVFVVRDNGAGFNMDYAKKLFEPFQRLHAASEFQGTGIGLATVHRIVSRHGGRISAQSAPNQGATFYFTLGEPA